MKPLTNLRRQWLVVTLIWGVLLFGSYAILQFYWPYATRWLLISTGASVYILHVLWRNLPNNHRQGETTLLPTFGLGNNLTLIRGIIISFLTGCILSPWPTGGYAWVPGLLYLATTVLDYGDGYIARARNEVTVLGHKLDLTLDSFGTLALTTLVVWYGQLPIFFLGMGFLYYLFVAGIKWREWRGLPVYPIHPSRHRRIFGGFYMVFLGCAFAPVLAPEVTTLAGFVFGIPVAVGFLRDWLVTIGTIDSASPTYQRMRHGSYILVAQWLPVFMRILLFLTMMMVYANVAIYIDTNPYTNGMIWLNGFMKGTIIITTIAMSFGFLGRVPPTGLILPIVVELYHHELQVYNGLALACAISLMLVSTGYYSFLPDLRRDKF
ncbi:CDP-alcohol phosphatidyltransferase family protein [Anaerolineales bacterium HSG25]|nr:CDP-alcohol phosphatidyltransferase family protein [Anaerolineales bacterium HSG25]